VAVGGDETPSVDAFAEAIGALSVGDKAVMEVMRDAARYEFTATMSARENFDSAEERSATAYRPLPSERRPSAEAGVPLPADRPYLGLRIGPVRTRTYRMLGMGRDWGVVVEDVISGSPADRHGVPRGAIIIGINGMRVERVSDVMAMMARLPDDRPVELTYVLGGRSYRQVIPLQPNAEQSTRREDAADPLPLELPPPPEPAAPLPESTTRPESPRPAAPESSRRAEPETELRLPPARGAAKVPADEERIEALQTELKRLRRRAAALEAALEKARGERDKGRGATDSE